MPKLNVEDVTAQLDKMGIKLAPMGKLGFRAFVGAYSVVYYPLSNVWTYRGRSYNGDRAAFVEWAQQMLQAA